ncbi:hypothetical protein AB0L63_12265 [Nocardia sp. NPDC051990]|uniref:hypothetical protein n=1 Tax=Nocardia sp. NPDC051990 TaxID=3155285 RepID=UPI003422BD70
MTARQSTAEQLSEQRKPGPSGAEFISAATTVVEQQHQAIAGVVFDAIGPIAEPAVRVHDAIASRRR